MRPKTLAALALVVLGLGAFILFVERDLPSSEERAELAKRVVVFEQDRVDALTLRPPGGAPSIDLVLGEDVGGELPPAASRWRMTAPLEAPAADGEVGRLLHALAELEKRRTLEDVPRGDAGLDPPRALVTLRHGGETTTLEIGAPVPGSETMLVAVAERDEVYVVADELFGLLDRSAEEWRNHRLFPARRDEIESVRLVAGDRATVLVRSGEELWLEEPVRDRADRELGERLLSSLVGLEATAFLDEEPQPTGAAAGGLVLVELAGREEPWRVELGPAVGSAGEDGGASEEVDALVDGVAVRVRGLREALRRDAEAWRSRAVLPLPIYRIDRIAIDDGSGELLLQRQEGDWRRGEERVSFTPISDLLYELDDLRADSFAPAARLADAEAELAVAFAADAVDDRGGEQEVRLFSAGRETLALVTGRPDALSLPGDALDAVAAKIAAVREAEPLAAESDLTDGDDGP